MIPVAAEGLSFGEHASAGDRGTAGRESAVGGSTGYQEKTDDSDREAETDRDTNCLYHYIVDKPEVHDGYAGSGYYQYFGVEESKL